MKARALSDIILASHDQPLRAVLIKREAYAQGVNPRLRLRDTAILKDGLRVHKVATHWVIVDEHTGEIHHHALKIETFKRSRAGWTFDPESSITLGDKDVDEIGVLLTFLRTIADDTLPAMEGEYVVMPVSGDVDPVSLEHLIGAISDGSKAALLTSALTAAKGDPSVLYELVERATDDPELSQGVAAAEKLASFSAALAELERLIDTDGGEGAFQTHLERNPWMFGSEYSELLDRRVWTRDKEQDFMLRRTVDGHLEIIEIETPLGGASLFHHDRAHDSHYARSEVAKVVGQVMQYLDDLDADRLRIEAHDREQVNKIRAKIIIGRDGDDAQCTALRTYYGHLQRIEILTFDQLVRIARQVLRYLQQTMAITAKQASYGTTTTLFTQTLSGFQEPAGVGAGDRGQCHRADG